MKFFDMPLLAAVFGISSVCLKGDIFIFTNFTISGQ